MTHAAYSAFDRPDILSVVFHPRADLTPPCPEDVLIKAADGTDLSARLHAGDPSAPLVLYFHGNGEIASDYDVIAPLYTRMGISLLVVDFRGYGRSGGTPTVVSLMQDAVAVGESLPSVLSEHNVTPSKQFLMGRSLGSASAIQLATQHPEPFSGLIIESGFAHELELIKRLGGPDLAPVTEFQAGFGTLDKIDALTLPLLIIHGSADIIIPFSDAEALLEHAGTPDKKLVRVHGAGHNDLLLSGTQTYLTAIQKFIEAH